MFPFIFFKQNSLFVFNSILFFCDFRWLRNRHKNTWNQIEMNRIALVCGIKQNQESHIKINTSFLTPSHLFSIPKIKKWREKTRQHQKEWEQKGMRKRVKNCGEGASNWTFKAIAVAAVATLAHAGNGNFSLLFISKDPFFSYPEHLSVQHSLLHGHLLESSNSLWKCTKYFFEMFILNISIFFGILFFCLNR